MRHSVNFDPTTNVATLGGQALVFHCHHYNSILQKTIEQGLGEEANHLLTLAWPEPYQGVREESPVVLANVLLGADIRPADVDRTGIRGLMRETLRSAQDHGRRIKLVCQAEQRDTGVVARVAPQEVPLDDPLAGLSGTSSMVSFYTDTLKQLSLIEFEPEPSQTAYGLLADLINLARGWY